MTDWYKNWFDSDEYLEVYKHRDSADASKLLSTIFNSIDIRKNAKILDAACGAGRHSILLSKMGFEVAGFDLSGNLLRIARRNAENENLNINFFQADLRFVELKQQYDLILNLFTSFGYFEDDDENFKFPQIAYKSLNSGGHFALDFFNKDQLIANLIPDSVRDKKDLTICENRRITNNRVVKRIEIRKNKVVKKFTESVKLYSPEEIISGFEQTGFKLKFIFGGYDGSKFDKLNSERAIFIFKK